MAPAVIGLMSKMLPTAVPLDFQLADDRVRLRTLVAEDAPVVHKACRDPQIERYTLFEQPARVDQTLAWIESQPELRARGTAIDFGIVPVGGVVPVGACGLMGIELEEDRALAGYWIAQRARGRGFASAALALLSEWALAPPLGLARLGLHIDTENESSQRVAVNAGFQFEGVMRSYMSVKGRRCDVARYSRLAGEARP